MSVRNRKIVVLWWWMEGVMDISFGCDILRRVVGRSECEPKQCIHGLSALIISIIIIYNYSVVNRVCLQDGRKHLFRRLSNALLPCFSACNFHGP
jgi:hypothetical protein